MTDKWRVALLALQLMTGASALYAAHEVRQIKTVLPQENPAMEVANDMKIDGIRKDVGQLVAMEARNYLSLSSKIDHQVDATRDVNRSMMMSNLDSSR